MLAQPLAAVFVSPSVFIRVHPWLILFILSFGAAAHGEGVVRLPTEMPVGEPYEGMLVSHPELTVQPLPPIEALNEPDPDLPPGAREGVFQYLSFQASWLDKGGGGPQALGASTLELTGVFGFPFPRRTTPLLITPGFAVSYLNGPEMPDLPARVYSTFVQFRHLRKITERLGTDLAVTPGVYSDFMQSSDEAFRMSGHFGAMWHCTDRFDIILGVAYLPYQDLRILPFAGFVWKPNDDWKIDITVPRPMIARRIGHVFPRFGGWGLSSYLPSVVETANWLYIAGELGGGSWAISRASGANDVITYRDLRLIFGYERENAGALNYHAEIAYVFSRKYDYDTNTPSIHPGNSLMLRLGAKY